MDVDPTEPGVGAADRSEGSPLGLIVALAVVAGTSWWGASRSAGVLRGLLELVVVLAGGYLVVLLVSLLALVLVRRWLDDLERPRAERWRDRFPRGVRLLVVLLLPAWAATGWLAAYDAAEWAASGVSVVTAEVVLVVLVALRPARARVPDGPEAPRHRRRED